MRRCDGEREEHGWRVRRACRQRPSPKEKTVMKALVVYDSRFGNTQQIAHVIGEVVGKEYLVQVIPAAEAVPVPGDLDLLIIGGPTHAHSASEGMKALLGTLRPLALNGVQAAAFDTRFQMARWLSGSAALVIGKRLRQAGCTMVVEPESFFVERGQEGPLLPGELERARSWAENVVAASRTPTTRRMTV
jgi:flavodoxin